MIAAILCVLLPILWLALIFYRLDQLEKEIDEALREAGVGAGDG